MRTRQAFADRETTFSARYGAIGSMRDSNRVISARLRALRIGLKFESQTDFAAAIGIEKQTYNPFEKGTRPLTFETACLIRQKFRVPVDWLFFGELSQAPRELLLEADAAAAAELAQKPRRRSKS